MAPHGTPSPAPARLARFCASPFALQGPRTSPLLPAAAALLLSATAAHAVPRADARLAPAAHARLVATVQALADREVGPGKVLVLDRAAPKGVEAARAARLLGIAADDPAELLTGAEVNNVLGATETCVVVGADPGASAADILTVEGIRPASGKVAAADAHLWKLVSQIGDCIHPGVGARESAAFSIQAAVAATRSPTLAGALVARQEISDLLEAAMAPSAGPAIAALVTGGDLGTRSWKEMWKKSENLGKSVAADRSDAGFGKAFETSGFGKFYYVPVREGVVATDVVGWAKANSSSPPLARLSAAVDAFTAGTALGTDRPRGDWRGPLRDAAREGDPVAAAMVGSAPAKEPSMPSREASEVRGRLIAFDRSEARISYEQGSGTFKLLDLEGRRIARGSHVEGITKTYQPSPEASEEASGPRR